MKIVVSLLLILVDLPKTSAQVDSARWYFTFANSVPRLKEDNQLIISADLPDGWGLYSSDFQSRSIGPAPTVIQFEHPIEFTMLDRFKPINPIQIVEASFDLTYSYFTHTAEFRQCVQFIRPQTKIKGVIKGQLFHITTGKTIDFEKPFDLTVSIDITN